ncbi:RNA-dependent DNA polymerase [Phytophthora megakarya]|uniref:RNA-directed DNA polymerase n=1 Tax=Phytophthora megakarya TaxID=4795 RepID=A0A225WH55_9STRA|nr:RNA-dependent DNA polymerase [Phytophthora megakarya]OWZ17075.1 RNA-dependent DNA polymerase [Phytophthora megakarya]
MARKDEEERRQRKRQRRVKRDRERHHRRVEREKLKALVVDPGDVEALTSKREGLTGASHGARLTEGATAEAKVKLLEPIQESRNALRYSASAVRALNVVREEEGAPKGRLVELATPEANWQVNLAAGNVVGESDARDGVAAQLVTTAMGLEAIGSVGVDKPMELTALQASRTRRRFEKRVRKAKAKEWRKVREWIRGNEDHTGKCAAFGPGKRRTLEKRYHYQSGSVYKQPCIERADDGGRPVRTGSLRAVRAPATATLPTARVKMRGQWCDIKLDTGAQYTVAGESWEQFGVRQEGLPPVDFVEGFTGTVAKVLGVWEFRMETQYGQIMTVEALVVQGAADEFLLGEDWMVNNGVKLDFTACEMKWYAGDIKKIVPFSCTNPNDADSSVVGVRVVRQAKVHTQTCHHVELAVAAPEGTTGIFVPSPRKEPHLLLAPTLSTVRGGRIKVPVLNLVGRTARLPPREKLGTWSPTSDDMTVMEVSGELDRERVTAWMETELRGGVKPLSNEGDLDVGDMSDEDKELLLRLLRSYPGLLEPREGCPPMTTLGVEHAIHTGNEAPIKVRPRRHAHNEQQVIDEEVGNMLRDKVIEPSSGAWGFPVVLVKKKDGSVRFCIDYRLLNAITKRDVYPLPRIDDTLDNLHGARRFSSLDLHAGYWQVPVAEADRDKTGFVTRQGLFRFVRMRFGLANAPGTFQRMMDAVLRGLTWESCLVYLDDVIVFSKGDMTRHVVELAMVLERLAQAGLSLKASKCAFAKEQLEYLGHELDATGVRPMESLVQSVREFPVPVDTKAVKRFVHMAGFYRRFVPDFASKAAPLTKLLRKDAAWCWAEPQHEAFECLKTALTERPVLAYPDFSRSFKLVTDASAVGLGATLTQDQGQGEQPVAYASKVNSPTVANYSITDLECAAVVWAVKLFRPYLYGRKFELVTDHAALKWLMTSKDLTGRLHRWALQLQEYHFDVVYRPGASNVVADALSRAPVNAVVAVTTHGDEGEMMAGRNGEEQLTDELIRERQSTDRTVNQLRLEGRHAGREIVDNDGLACIRASDGSLRVLLPASLWAVVLRECHDSIFAGHLRVPQTYARVAAQYWWPGMKEHIRRWVRSCRDCGTRKARAREVIPPLRSQGIGDVGDRWALDVAGPLPMTARGCRYVVAAVDYATRYAVVAAVPTHTAQDIAKFIMDKLVLSYGPMRELVMDGAPELNGEVIEALVSDLQARQITPVPYRPALLGLVERFHRTWKDMVALFVAEAQDDWDRWLSCATYAYNGAQHSAMGYSPNELMMGRRLRAPNELLRSTGVTQVGAFADYHTALVSNLERAKRAAMVALAKDQRRRAKYYDTRARRNVVFGVGDRVWVLRPPRGRGITKLAHQWVGPAQIVEDAGFDNWRVTREDTGEHLVVHCSFLVRSECPSESLGAVADRILRELAEEDSEAANVGVSGQERASPDVAGIETAGAGNAGSRW